jgi:hypothetical protein
MRSVRLCSAILLGLAAASCSARHTIDSGLWELSYYDMVKTYTEGGANSRQERLRDDYTKNQRVEVVLDYNYDKLKKEEIETIEIHLLEPYDPEKNEITRENPLHPIAGFFESGGRGAKRVTLQGQDDENTGYNFALKAEVHSRKRIKGSFLARPKDGGEFYVVGTWELIKIPDED